MGTLCAYGGGTTNIIIKSRIAPPKRAGVGKSKIILMIKSNIVLRTVLGATWVPQGMLG